MWNIVRSRTLTKRERKTWKRRAYLEGKKAAERGFVPCSAELALLPVDHRNALMNLGFLIYVKTHESKGGHSKAIEVLHVHYFVEEVFSYVRKKWVSPRQRFTLAAPAVNSWPNSALKDFEDKIRQFANDPHSMNAVRGGMELELDAGPVPPPVLVELRKVDKGNDI